MVHVAPVYFGQPRVPLSAFDGTNDYMARGANITGVSDGKIFTFSVWFKASNTGATQNILGGQLVASPQIWIQSTGQLRVTARAADGTTLLLTISTNKTYNDGLLHHAMGSFDLANGVAHLFVDGQPDIIVTDLVNTDMDNTTGNYYVGAFGASQTNKLNGSLGQLWVSFSQYIDFSVRTNREKFFNNAPRWLGEDGDVPTGVAPDLYFRLGPSQFNSNFGTGDNFTITGTLAADGFVPSFIKKPLSLRDAIPSCLMDIDFTRLECYDGSSQRINNLVSDPIDGSFEDEYDCMNGSSSGATSTDMTFVGTPGDPAAYMSGDGNDVLRSWDAIDTDKFVDLPKTTGGSLPVTFALAFRHKTLSGTITALGNAVGGSNNYVRVRSTSSQSIGIQHSQGAVTDQANFPGAMSDDSDYVFIGALAADGTVTMWRNGNKNSQSITLAAGTGDGGLFSVLQSAASGTRLYAFSVYDEVLTDAQAAYVLAEYRSRHNRNYNA